MQQRCTGDEDAPPPPCPECVPAAVTTYRAGSPARAGASRSGGSGERDVDLLAGDRVREREPRRVQELPLEPVQTARPVLAVAADRMADRRHVDADLVRAPGVQHDPQQRRVPAAPLELEVRARLARLGRCRSTSASGRGGGGRSARRSSPCRAGGLAVDERQVLASQRCAAPAAPSARGGRRRSWRRPAAPRCRGRAGARFPARHGSPPSAPAPPSACASVPVRWPRAGWTTTPAGLSTTSRCSSSYAISIRRRRGCRLGRRRRWLVDRHVDLFAGADRVALRT